MFSDAYRQNHILSLLVYKWDLKKLLLFMIVICIYNHELQKVPSYE